MYSAGQTSPRRDAQPSQPDPDSDSASATRAEGMRKRPRSGNDEPPTAACDQCRLRKVRCDRRQPECSNCRKAGVECNSSNTLKRVNHTKQLRDDFSVVLKHLSDVDQALGTLTELTRQIAARPCPHTANPHTVCPPSNEIVPLPTPGSLDFMLPSAADDDRASNDPLALNGPLFETIEFDQGGERLYGYPAPLVLIKSLLRQATGALLESDKQGESLENGDSYITRALQDMSARATLQQKLDDFPFNVPCRESVSVSDANPVTTPPRLMVNLFVDGYLHNINTRTPIFDDVGLRRAIDAHYGDELPQESRAWALIINNIVLLELGLEIQAARASHSNSRGMNDDILPSFLRNCDRAIGNLEAFMGPSLVNVQALMTLTLAAREFYNNATAEKVCHAACQVGRAIGLHRSGARYPNEKGTLSHESEQERERLFRVLYTLDKQRVFMTGQPCDLHMFDSDHRIGPDRNHEQAEPPIGDAFDHMMTIWEEIYLNLYSLRAASSGGETRMRQMRLVTGSVEKFSQKHAGLMSPISCANGTADIDPLHIELVYGHRVTQVLILRCERGNEQTQEKMRELARSSLRLILEVCKTPHTTPRLALLASMFRNYPMVAFIELIAFHLASLFRRGECDPTVQADVSLLRAICDQLHILQHDNLTHIFYARLKLGLLWALETLEALGEVLIRSSPQPRGMAGFSPQRDSRRSTESSRNPTNAPSPMAPDISNACGLHPSRGNQSLSSISSSRNGEDDFVQSGLAELTNFGFFTPGTDRMDLASRPLTAACQFNTSSNSQSQSDLNSGPLTGNSNWGDFNMDFFQGVSA
ncbi:hypothetical protein GGS26DRAFT_546053 [Hypomontagnella submonticulosa]|nr:hypothetical protein GGS26DRAFT_546053 [Hypomontagnella submonticulosa]